MGLFDADYEDMVSKLLPSKVRGFRLTAYVKTMATQIQFGHDIFQTERDARILDLKMTSRVVEIEYYLNTLYSIVYTPATRDADILAGNIIYIDNIIDDAPLFVYRKNDPTTTVRYVYRKWDSLHPYLVGEFAREGNTVYVATNGNTGNLPSANPADWDVHKAGEFIYRKGEFATSTDFTVFIPTAVTFDTDFVTEAVNVRILPGKKFNIDTY